MELWTREQEKSVFKFSDIRKQISLLLLI